MAFVLVPRMSMVAEINDVRPGDSAPLEWYALGGIFIHDPSRSQPQQIHPSESWLTPYQLPVRSLPLGHRFTFVVDSTSEGVTWTTGTIPSVSHVVEAYFHTHSDMVDDLWFFRASPAQLGLLSPPWVLAFDSFLNAPIPPFKEHLKQRANASNVDLICRFNARPQSEYVPDHNTHFERKSSCVFEKQQVPGDLQWTYVGFFKAQATGLPKEFPMHGTLRMIYTKTEESSTFLFPFLGGYRNARDRAFINADEECSVMWTPEYWKHDNPVYRSEYLGLIGLRCALAMYLTTGVWTHLDVGLFMNDFMRPWLHATFWSAPLVILTPLTIILGVCFSCCLCCTRRRQITPLQLQGGKTTLV